MGLFSSSDTKLLPFSLFLYSTAMGYCKNFCIALRIPPKGTDAERGTHLANARRFCADLALADALLGIVLMILAMEFLFHYKLALAHAMRWALLASTVILLVLILRFHVLHTKLHMHRCAIRRWQCALRPRQRLQIFLELCVCAISPLPVLHSTDNDAFLFVRVYWLPRVLHLHSRLSTDATAKSIAGAHRVKTNTRFLMKRLLFLYPGVVLTASVIIFWLVGGYLFRLCESNVADGVILDYSISLWLMCVTFLTIGYGDIYPHTVCGRLLAIFTGIVGIWVATSIIVAIIVQKISFNHEEERVHKFMRKRKHAETLKSTAAQVLKESWYVYKNKKLGNQAMVRYHQSRQNSAYHNMRKLREQLFQDEATIEDVAKSLYDATELIRNQTNNQRINERFNNLEQRLNHMQEGIVVLTELLAKKETNDHLGIKDQK